MSCDKRFSGQVPPPPFSSILIFLKVRIPNECKTRSKGLVVGDEDHVEQAREVGIEGVSFEQYKVMVGFRNRKLGKKISMYLYFTIFCLLRL